MSKKKHYKERDIIALDETGGYYSRHGDAMTGEGLHSKCDIAAELGYRDMLIDSFRPFLELVANDFDFDSGGQNFCFYCGAQWKKEHDGFKHKPDCFHVKAKKVVEVLNALDIAAELFGI